ncbi:hypothetical protein V6N13_099630 [Hibiscus sabdariffa]
MFVVAASKQGTISYFGRFEDDNWIWNIQLHRQLFDWQIDIWNNFITAISSVRPGFLVEDSIRWSGNSNGYSSSFNKLCSINDSDVNFNWKLVLANLVPPIVELFMWKLVLGKAPVKV